MDKNSLQASKQLWKGRIAIITLVGMLVGILCARFLASLSMILFGLNALWDVHPRRWGQQRWWLLGLVWVLMYALSGFWSADTGEWFAHLQVKFPFLFLPLAFAFLPKFTDRQMRAFTACLLFVICLGAAYSLSFYWQNKDDLVHSYKYAQVLKTPVYNDHIAFSTLVAMTIAWVLYYFPALRTSAERVILGLLVVFLAFYLHLLAAKTGLVALYILIAGMIGYKIRKSPKMGWLLLSGFIIAVGAAYALLPTLRERVGYTMVSWRSYVMGERTGVYSDAGRIISYDLALKSIAENPVAGVGAGDVFTEMKRGYARWYPEVPELHQLWPHNQFLTSAMAIGIPATLIFMAWIAAPMRRLSRDRNGLFLAVIWLMLLVPLMVDLFLEVQFGVAVYLIFLLWFRKMHADGAVQS